MVSRLMTATFLFFITFPTTGSADPLKLTRERSKELITKDDGFRVVTTLVIVGHGIPGMGDAHVKQTYESLQSKGLVALKEVNIGTPFRQHLAWVTEGGKRYVVNETDSRFVKGMKDISVRACEREVVEVTGIEYSSERLATVHIKYRSISPTPFVDVRILEPSTPGAYHRDDCSDQVKNGRVIFALFDDGWRIRK
jgi:hypothetical protein